MKTFLPSTHRMMQSEPYIEQHSIWLLAAAILFCAPLYMNCIRNYWSTFFRGARVLRSMRPKEYRQKRQ